MTSLLFSVIAATSLAATGIGASSETRSAQSLPAEHLVVAPAQATATGAFHQVNRLADATLDNSGSISLGEAKCKHHGGHWDSKDTKCTLNPVVYIIGAATTAGFIYAITSHDNSGSGHGSVSN